MTGSNVPGDAAPAGEQAEEPLREFDEAEADVEPGEEAPPGDALTDEERTAIQDEIHRIHVANLGKAPDEQISLDPKDVS